MQVTIFLSNPLFSHSDHSRSFQHKFRSVGKLLGPIGIRSPSPTCEASVQTIRPAGKLSGWNMFLIFSCGRCRMEERPFPELKVASADFLDEIKGRMKCPKCGRSRKWYCYTCYVPVAEVADKIPKVKVSFCTRAQTFC